MCETRNPRDEHNREGERHFYKGGNQDFDGSENRTGHVIRFSDLVFILTCATLLLAWLVWQLPWVKPGRLEQLFIPEHVQHYGAIDVSDRRRAYQSVLLFILGFSAVGASMWSRRVVLAPQWLWKFMEFCVGFMKRRGAMVLGLMLGTLYIGTLASQSQLNVPDSAFGLYFIPSRSMYCAFTLISLGVLIGISTIVLHVKTKLLNAMLWLLIGVYISLAMFPGIVEKIPTFNLAWPMIIYTEISHGSVLGDAYRLAAGQELFSDFNVYYGVLKGVLLAIYMRVFGNLTLGEIFRLLQIFQIIFCLATIGSYYLWKPKKPMILLFALLLVVPWIHNNHTAILFVNHSAWRSIGLPVGLLLLLMMRRVSSKASAFWLGISSAFLILNNPETGIALSCGYIVYLLARCEEASPSRVALLGGIFSFGGATALAIFFLLFRLGLGPLPSLSAWGQMIQYIRQTSSGFAGRPYYLDPLALLIFIHLVYVTIESLIHRLRGQLSWRQSIKVAISATSLIWFAYYVNGTEIWYLWTYLFLYGYFISSYMDTRILRLTAQRSLNLFRQIPRMHLHYRAVVFSFILGPAILSSNYQAVHAIWNGMQLQYSKEAENAMPVSGIWLRPEIASFLNEKAGYLLEQNDRKSLIYITANSYFMPLLTGIYSGLPIIDVYYGTMEKDDYNKLVARILELTPKRILFDDPSVNLGLPDPQQKFYARLQQRLTKEYQPVATVHGWQVWKKRMPGLTKDLTAA